MKKGLLILFAVLFLGGKPGDTPFMQALKNFIQDYRKLDIPPFTFDYTEYFSSIPPAEQLQKQKTFFEKQKAIFAGLKPVEAKGPERLSFLQVLYEINFNLQRIKLEEEWVKSGRNMPSGGLHSLNNYKEWYLFFIKKYTSLDKSAEEVMAFGKTEVERVKKEIEKIMESEGFKDSASFYNHLKQTSFYITDKQQLIKHFGKIDSIVRSHLSEFTGQSSAPPVYAMEWPNAGGGTPPGIYLNRIDNPYGKDVFQFNFYRQHFNKRAAEWLYIHEAIPGHHLQFTFDKHRKALDELFIYPGNFEGWACYVEYYGKDLGLYNDPYSYLGKWEWDLVRSARLVLDAGIHYYGWSREEALAYWKANITGQDEIAEREITRVTNWVAQALSYKLGADYIFRIKEQWQKENPGKPLSDFHRSYLEAGRAPLPIIAQALQK